MAETRLKMINALTGSPGHEADESWQGKEGASGYGDGWERCANAQCCRDSCRGCALTVTGAVR